MLLYRATLRSNYSFYSGLIECALCDFNFYFKTVNSLYVSLLINKNLIQLIIILSPSRSIYSVALFLVLIPSQLLATSIFFCYFQRLL